VVFSAKCPSYCKVSSPEERVWDDAIGRDRPKPQRSSLTLLTSSHDGLGSRFGDCSALPQASDRQDFSERSQAGAPGKGSAGAICRASSPRTPESRTNWRTPGKKRKEKCARSRPAPKTPSRRHSLTGIGLTCDGPKCAALDGSRELLIELEVTCGG
jgi:hypothetical protein